MKDPARAVLATALDLTVEKRRFPLESDLARRVKKHGDALKRLLDDGRYLVRALGFDQEGRLPRRVAITIRGVFEAETPLGQREQQGLVRTYDRLCAAIDGGVFGSGRVTIKRLHALVASDIPIADFRRWCTMLCSPRLQGRHTGDPIGFYGWSDGFGAPSRRSGYFVDLRVAPWFRDWGGLPERGRRRAFLLSENGLRVEIDARGTVDVYCGTGRIAVLPDSLGANVFATLVTNRGVWFHSLDLQARGANSDPVKSAGDPDRDDVRDNLFNSMGIEFATAHCTPEELERLAACIRRADLLDDFARAGKSPLPKWAINPAARKQELCDDLQSALVDGPIRADHPRIKNATRAVRRALDSVLGLEELGQFRGDFEGHERIRYTPS